MPLKRSQKVSQKSIPIHFAFTRLPVTWTVVSGERLQELRAAQLKAYARKDGKELTAYKVSGVLNRIQTKGPVLYGEMRKIERANVEALKELDGWYWRDRFFGLPETNLERLADFLTEVGAWPSSDAPNLSTPGHALTFPAVVRAHDVWAFREDLKDALLDRTRFQKIVAPMLSNPKTWIDLYARPSANDFSLRLELSDVAAGVVSITNARHMLFATVLADVARGIRFKVCKRKDCRIPFAITSKHKREYHDRACAHLAGVRRKRKLEKRQKRAEEAQPARKPARH